MQIVQLLSKLYEQIVKLIHLVKPGALAELVVALASLTCRLSF
jgi:hypothetical protein